MYTIINIISQEEMSLHSLLEDAQIQLQRFVDSGIPRENMEIIQK